MNPQVSLQEFEEWAIYFVGPIQPRTKKTGARYIIMVTKYLTKWDEAQPMKDCSVTTTGMFIFEYILSRFGCPKIFMSDRGSHFLNEMIVALLKEFQMYHQKITPYHPQANRMVEAFNKIMENALTKICNENRNDWDVRITIFLWDYQITCKKLTRQKLFMLVYGQEAVMPMEYIMPNLRIVAVIEMTDWDTMEEHLMKILELEEYLFLAGFDQQV